MFSFFTRKNKKNAESNAALQKKAKEEMAKIRKQINIADAEYKAQQFYLKEPIPLKNANVDYARKKEGLLESYGIQKYSPFPSLPYYRYKNFEAEVKSLRNKNKANYEAMLKEEQRLQQEQNLALQREVEEERKRLSTVSDPGSTRSSPTFLKGGKRKQSRRSTKRRGRRFSRKH